MAGLYLIDDKEPSGLPSEYGVDDIPLIIQGATVQSGGHSPGLPPPPPSAGSVTPSRHVRTALCGFHELGTFASPECLGSALLQPLALDRGRIPSCWHRRVSSPVADLVLRSVPHDLDMSRGDNITSGTEDTFGILRITRANGDCTGKLPATLPAAAHPGANSRRRTPFYARQYDDQWQVHGHESHRY